MTHKSTHQPTPHRKARRRAKQHSQQPAFLLNVPLRVTLPLHQTVPPWPPDLLAAVMQRQTHLFLELLNGLTDYIFFKDTNSVYFNCNRAFAHLVGLKNPRYIMHKTDYDLPWQVPGDTADVFRKRDQQIFAGEHLADQLEILTLPDKSSRCVSVTKLPLYDYTHDSEGVCYGLLGIARDVTPQKEMAASLDALKVQLAQNQATYQASADCLYPLLHPPLQGILACLQAAKPTKTDHPSQTQVEQALAACHALDYQLGSLIQLIKHPDDRAHADQPIDLPTLCQSVFTLCYPMGQQQGLALSMQGVSDLPTPHIVEGTRLRFIMTGLLIDAMQQTQRGKLQISLQTDPTINGCCTFYCRIEAAAASHVSPQRAETEHLMASIRHLLIQMGGDIWMDDTQSSGLCWSLTLPLHFKKEAPHE